MTSILKKVTTAVKKVEKKVEDVAKNVATAVKKSGGGGGAAVASAPVLNNSNRSVVPTKSYVPTATSVITKKPTSVNPGLPENKVGQLSSNVAAKYLPASTKVNPYKSTISGNGKVTSTPTTSTSSRSSGGSSFSSYTVADGGAADSVDQGATDDTADNLDPNADNSPEDTPVSYKFNPETLTSASNILKNFNIRLNDTMNDSWNSKGTKQEKAQGLYESTANGYAKLFDSGEQFDTLYNTNADFKNNIDSFTKAGGDVNTIKSRIQAPVLDTGTQSTADYLASISNKVDPNAPATQQEALKSLIPERELAQKEIQRIAAIPEQYKNLYFGTPEDLGIYEQKRIEAEQKKKIIERKEKSDAADLKAMANYQIEKNSADFEISSAQIEENRLAARNYTTGMLAKLGALNTTGEAPILIATVEQKYQQQSQQLQNQVKQANNLIGITLKDKVNDLEDQRDEDIWKLGSDLTKSKEDILKETTKLEQDSAKQIYSILDKAANEYRTQSEKFKKEATALAAKNAKEYARIAGKYSPGSSLKGFKVSIDQKLEASRGADDHFVDPNVYLQSYKDWLAQRKGTQKDFTAAFPPKNYVNPANTWLPSFLRPTAAKTTTKSSSTSADDI